jgi:hypothetical protein
MMGKRGCTTRFWENNKELNTNPVLLDKKESVTIFLFVVLLGPTQSERAIDGVSTF